MASRSRLLPLFPIAVLAIVVLAAGCRRTMPQEPFHYSEVPGEELVGPADLVIKIGEHCHADPERVVLDTEATGKPGSHDQVVWVVPSEQSGDEVKISAKPAAEQDPRDPSKGTKIRDLFQTEYEIASLKGAPPNNAIRSGKPKKSLLVLTEHSATWKYNIEYFRDGKKLCAYDPVVCIQKPGTDGCSMTN